MTMTFPDVIWKQICSYMSPTDIKTVRQVCPIWSQNTAIKDRLYNTTIISLDSLNDVESILKTSLALKSIRFTSEEKETNLTEFLTSFQKIKTYPFAEINELRIECAFNSKSLFELLKKCSTTLIFLKLHFNRFDQKSPIKKLEIDFELPKLLFFSPKNVSEEYEWILEEIAKISPNLKYFESNTFCKKPEFVLNNIGNNSKAFKNLVKIEIKSEANTDNVQKLNQLQIQDLTFKMKAIESIRPLLNGNWKKTINTLMIKKMDFLYFKKYDTFPKLEEIRKLTLIFSMEPHSYSIGNEDKSPLAILLDLPKLRSLSVQNTNFASVFDPNGDVTCNLESLQVPLHPLPPVLIEPMSTAFPNLKELDFYNMSNEALLLVCQHLKTLEVLKVGKGISDFGLTAIETRNIKKNLKKIENGQDPNQFRKKPVFFIGNLTNLKRITVSSTKITDASVILGFAYCHQLTSIKMGRPVLTDKSLKFLADCENLKLQKLDLKCHNKLTIHEATYFKEKRPSCHLNLEYYNPTKGLPDN